MIDPTTRPTPSPSATTGSPAHALRWFVRAGAALILFAAGPARGDSSDAQALFDDAVRLLRAGQTAEACDAFAASNRIETRTGTLMELGACREKNAEIASAWSAYKDAVNRAKDEKKRKIAQLKAQQLEARLSYLTVSVPEDARIDGLVLTRNGEPLDHGLWNRPFPVDGGAYVIGGRAPGHEEWSTTVVVAPEGAHVGVEVPKFKELAKLLPANDGDGDSDAEGTDAARGGRPRRFTGKRKLAVGVGAVGVAALGGAIALGVSAKAQERAAHDLCPEPAVPCADAGRANDLVASGRQRALLANIGFGVAAGAAIGAAVLWIVGAPASVERATAHLVPTVDRAGGGLAFTGQF